MLLTGSNVLCMYNVFVLGCPARHASGTRLPLEALENSPNAQHNSMVHHRIASCMYAMQVVAKVSHLK